MNTGIKLTRNEMRIILGGETNNNNISCRFYIARKTDFLIKVRDMECIYLRAFYYPVSLVYEALAQ